MATKESMMAFISCGRAFQHDYFICNTQQLDFIPTMVMPTVNNKTETDRLHINENTILSILKELNISKSPSPDEMRTRLQISNGAVRCNLSPSVKYLKMKHH